MYVLMKCVAEAVMAKGLRGLVEMVPGGGFLYEVATDAVKRMRERKQVAALRDEVMQAATAAVDEVKKAAKQVAKEVAPKASAEDRITLEIYLTQIPGAVRQSLKRPDDPSGKTVPPDFTMKDGADLVARLPQRAAQFRPDMPLPGKPGWKLVELLGAGGFGEVWLAANPTLSALKGAVKFGLDPQARDRLLRHEGALINRVMEQGRHPNVVTLLDAHLEGDAPWLMYEYAPGGDLSGLILAWQALDPATRVARATAALRTLAAAVGHFHRLSPPIVHRDLKPANILLQGASESCADLAAVTLRITDFGIGGVAAATALAHTTGAGRPGSTGFLLSQLSGSYTPLYASPQQQAGAPPDPRDDVHALGVIGFQMLTGRLNAPPGVDYARTLRKIGVPEQLIELLGDCAAYDPDHRPRDGADLADRLAKLTSPTPPGEAKIAVTCPLCGAHVKIPASAAGRRVKCPVGGHIFTAPGATQPEPAPPVPPLPPPPAPERKEPPRRVRVEAEVIDAVPAPTKRSKGSKSSTRTRPVSPPQSSSLGAWIAGVLVLGCLVVGFGVFYAISSGKRSSTTGSPKGGLNAGTEGGDPNTPALPPFVKAKTPPPATDIPGLVAYWSLDEGQGDQAFDTVNQLPASLNGGKWVPGIRGKAVELNGSTDFVDLGRAPALNFAAAARFTIACWVKSESRNGTVFWFRGSPDGLPILGVQIVDGRLRSWVRQDGAVFQPNQVIGALPIRNGEWHHVLLTRDADGVVELFQDGRSAGKGFGKDSAGKLTTNMRALGVEPHVRSADPRSPELRYLPGAVDEFCVFSRVLSFQEITKLAGRDP